MAAIFWFSAQNGTASDGMSIPIADWLRQSFPFHLTTEQANHLVRKAAHFTIYFLLGCFVSGWSSGFRWSAAVWIPVSTAFCACYAAGDEFHQSFTAMRSPSIYDVLLDTAGALTGALFVLLLCHIVRKSHSAEGGKSMICPNCGYDNPDNVVCCVKCGEELVDSKSLFQPEQKKIDMQEPDVYEPYEDGEEQEAPRKSHVSMIVLTVFLCLLAAVAGLSFAWHQERGAWPWEQLMAAGQTLSTHTTSSSSSTVSSMPELPQNYSAADIAAAIRKSNFQAFGVSDAEISGIKTDTQTLSDAALVQFTVTKAMATVHMQMRIPHPSTASGADSSAVSSKVDTPAVTSWSVDLWKLTGTWNDSAGNTLLVETCSAGSISAYYISAGTTDSRLVNGSISETGYVSLVSSKAQISGQFSPGGTASMTVTLDGEKSQTQQFVMLSTAVANLPTVYTPAPSSASVSSNDAASAVESSVPAVNSQISAVSSQKPAASKPKNSH